MNAVRDERRRDFFIVDNVVVRKYLPLIGETAYAVYCCLLSHAGVGGDCFPSVPTLAAECGRSERTVRYALRKLEEHHLIHIEPRFEAGKKCHTSNLYRILSVAHGQPEPPEPEPLVLFPPEVQPKPAKAEKPMPVETEAQELVRLTYGQWVTTAPAPQKEYIAATRLLKRYALADLVDVYDGWARRNRPDYGYSLTRFASVADGLMTARQRPAETSGSSALDNRFARIAAVQRERGVTWEVAAAIVSREG